MTAPTTRTPKTNGTATQAGRARVVLASRGRPHRRERREPRGWRHRLRGRLTPRIKARLRLPPTASPDQKRNATSLRRSTARDPVKASEAQARRRSLRRSPSTGAATTISHAGCSAQLPPTHVAAQSPTTLDGDARALSNDVE